MLLADCGFIFKELCLEECPSNTYTINSKTCVRPVITMAIDVAQADIDSSVTLTTTGWPAEEITYSLVYTYKDTEL